MPSVKNNRRNFSTDALTERERAYFGARTEKTPGSAAWCWQTLMLMQSRWKQKTLNEEGFQALLDDLKAHRAWDVIPPTQPYGSLEALLKAEIGCGEKEAKDRLDAQATKRGERTDMDDSSMSRKQRAQKNGIGTTAQYELDYLAGHAPALLTEVQEGHMSIHRAYQQARGISQETPLTTLHRVWRQVEPDDRLRFLVEMLTPNERRARQMGCEDLDEPRRP